MISKQIEEKGFLVKLLEKGIKIYLKKECNKINNIKIDVSANSIQIIQGLIEKIHIEAKEINYKEILIDEIDLEANKIKFIFNIKNIEFNLKNTFLIEFKISLSENSLSSILFSNSWNWIGKIISKEILDNDELESIQIKDDQIEIKASKNYNIINEVKKVYLRVEKGKIYLKNKDLNKSILIPIEDKVCIKNITIKNNLINILAISPISF